MGISAFNKKSTLEKCVYTDLLDVVNKFSFDSEKYSINFKTDKSYVSIESSDDSMYNKPKKSCVNRFYRIKANIIIKDKKTQETCSKVLTLLDVPYYDQGLIVNNSSKELVDSYDRSTGWLIQRDKGTGDDTKKCGFNLTFRDLRREKLNFKYVKSRIVLVKDKTKTLSLGYFIKALTKLNYDEISQKIGDIPCLNRSLINEESLEVCLIETAKFLDLYGKKSDSNIDDIVKSKVSQNPSAVHQDIRNSVFNLKYIKLDSSAKDRYNYKTRFENRADGFELNEDLSLNNIKLSKGSILTKEILRKIDESDCTSLSVKKDSILFELKKYAYTGNLNEDDMFTMLNIFAYVIEGLGEEDDNYSLENRQLMNMDKLAHIQITENLNFLCKSTKEYSESDPSIISILKLLNLGSTKSTNYGSLMEKFTSASEKNLQSQTDTNIISVLSMGTKASTNIDNRAKTTEMVSIQPSSRGRTDPFDAPESQKMGLVQYKCVTTVCEDGQLKVPYIRVENCKPVSDEPEYLLPYEDKVAFIAQFDEDFKEEKILVRHDDDFVFVDRDKVNYMEYSPYQGSGISTSLMPFPGNSAGKRINMWDNESRQAVFISGLERPIVGTGFDGFTDEGVIRAKEILSSFYDQNQYSESLGPREDFINSIIKLIDIHSSFEKRTLKFKVLGREIIVEYNIKYMARNIVKNLSSYRIKYSKDLEYQGEDIVVHDIFVDVNKYDVDMRCTDFGHLNTKEADFSKGFAVGINLVVGFKTHGSYTIEDSIVISRRLLGKGSLTSFYMETFDSDARVSEDSVEFFGFSYDNIPSHMNSSGIAKVGETLAPGSMIINKVITNPNKSVKSSKDYKDSPVFLPDHIGGEVVYAGIEEVSSIKSEKVSRAVIIIASTSDISVGDKFCGRYGNKGVCGKIVEECDMAYNSETGLPLDIVLNPLGVPARMNLSQLLEGLVAFCMKQEGKIALTTPFCKKQGDFIEQLKAEHNFQPQILTDGRSGRKFEKPINVSVMYFLKLHHTTSTKLNWCSLNAPRQPESLQPGQGVGQKLGEMEFWVLESAQIPRFEQICKSILSDDMNASNNLINSLKVSSENISIEGSTNPADIWLQVFLRSNGQNLYSEQNNSIIVDDSNNTLEYNVELLTSGKCRSLGSPLKLNSGYGKSSSASALHDTSIFGNCDRSRTRVNNRDKWSYIELGCEIINPFFISSSDHTLIKLLNVWFSKELIPSTHISTGIRSYINSGENEVTICKLSSVADKILKCDCDIVFESDEKEREGYKVAFVIPRGQKLDNIICGSRYSHIDGIVELFKRSKIEDEIKRFQDIVNTIKSKPSYKKEDYLNALTMLTYCTSLRDRGLDFKDFIIDCYPICPAALRPEINRGNNKNDFDLHYQNIINACNSEDFYKSLKVYFTISNFLGYYEEKDAPCIFDKTPLVSAMKDKNIKNILTKFASPDSSGSNKKKAFFRDKVQSKRVLVSGRSSIVPADINADYFNEDDIDSLHCGLPFLLALGMYTEFVESYIAETFLNRRDDGNLDISSAKRYIGYIKSNDRKSFNWNDDKYPLTFDELKEKIVEYLETKVVILGRQPSLHILSIRAFKVKIVEGSAIKLNTLFCVGFNGDFDGDQMYVVGCLDKESEEECLNNLSHLASAMAPRDGSCVLQPKQDILVGMYICTMLENNKLEFSAEDVESALSYSNVDRLRNDFYNGDIKFYNLCCLKFNDRYYLSTVGRLVFNSYIDGTFTSNKFTNPWKIPNIENLDLYSELMFDAIIGEKNNLPHYVSISQVQGYIMNNFSGYNVGLIMDNLARLGFYSSDYYGLSISLSDFVEDEVIDKYNELTNELRQDVENCYIDGFITEDEKQQSILDIYTGCNKIIENEVTKLYGRDNNLFIMRDSGARGSASQLNQSVGMIGIMMKNSNDFFSVPVTGNYLNGLSSYENFITSFGARATFAKTYDETPDSGHLTRIAVYLMSGFKIVEDKCNKEPYPVKLERDGVYKAFVNGEEVKFKDIKNIHDVKDDLLKLVGGKILKEDESEAFNCVKYMTTDNSINDDIISVILKNHFTDLNYLDEFGNEINLKIIYHLSSMFKSLLLYRTCYEDIPGLISSGKGKNNKINLEKKYIGKNAIEYLDTHDVKYLKVSLMLNCSSVGGVCAECYGLEKSTKELPKVGKNIGITAAQSIGEPASQLILSSSNSGGVAGGSVTNAVQLIKTLMTGSLIQKIEKSICAPCQDIVKVTQIGGESMIKMKGVSTLIDSNKVLVKNGEVVKEGQPLTIGYINPNSLYEYNIDRDSILERQLILLHLYYDMFSCNNINLDIRHFETLVRCQSNLVTVTESDNPNYVPGLKYELADVINNGEGKVNYIYNALSNSEDVVKNNSGALSLYGFQYQVKYASNIFSEGRPMKLKSGLDRSMIGYDMTGKTTKFLPRMRNVSKPDSVFNRIEKEDSDSSSISSYISILSNNSNSDSFDVDINLEDLDLFSAIDTSEIVDDSNIQEVEILNTSNSYEFDDDLDVEDAFIEEEDNNISNSITDEEDTENYNNLDDLDVFS